jgi:carbon monoxide dehydrogenase subunit G
MNDSQRIPAAKEKVWAALNDPAVLKQCIPGCQSLEMSSPTDMTSTVVFRVGPVRATFGGKVTLSDLYPPNSSLISGKGSGGVAGFAKGGATVRLESESPEVTILRYAVDAQIDGKLAQLGQRLIDSTAKKLASEFFAAFGAVVGVTAEAPDQANAAPKGWLGKLRVILVLLQPSIVDNCGHLVRFDLAQRLRSRAQISPAGLDFGEGSSVAALGLDGIASLQTTSEIYMRQSEPPYSRKSAAPGGIFGSLASSNGAQRIDRAEV